MSYTKITRGGASFKAYHNSVGPGGDFNFVFPAFQQQNDTFTGNYNPNWRAQIKAVQNATTFASGKKYKVEWAGYPRCSYAYDRNVSGNWRRWATGDCSGPGSNAGVSGFLPTEEVAPTSSVTSAYNRAIEKLYDRLNYFQSRSQIGEDIGERKQTLNALKNPLPRVREHLLNQHYKTTSDLARWKSPVRLAQALADTHIEFAFGWLPLASSIGSAIASLQNRTLIANYIPFHCKGEALFSGTATSEIASMGGRLDCYVNRKRWSSQVTVFQGVWAEECLLPQAAVSRALGLQPRHILPTIWNLIPYSFLVDYFTNIGTIAESLSVPWGGVKWCCETSRTVNNCEASFIHKLRDFNFPNIERIVYIHSTPGSVKSSVTTFSRGPQYGLPLPELEFTSLRDITGRQWLNMAALAVGQSAKLLLSLGKAVAKAPDLPQLFVKELKRRGGYRDPYPFHRK